jgi:hypothetical protein
VFCAGDIDAGKARLHGNIFVAHGWGLHAGRQRPGWNGSAASRHPLRDGKPASARGDQGNSQAYGKNCSARSSGPATHHQFRDHNTEWNNHLEAKSALHAAPKGATGSLLRLTTRYKSYLLEIGNGFKEIRSDISWTCTLRQRFLFS